jgi:hypothetical protein
MHPWKEWQHAGKVRKRTNSCCDWKTTKKNKMIFPVITLYQPWATWIMREWKTIETRTHNRFKSLNGTTILIHAGATTDGSELTTRNPYLTTQQILQDPDEVINGHILGSAFVFDFKLLNESHSEAALIDCKYTQRWGLFLENVHRFGVPIPVKGEMGIWYFDINTMQKVKKPKQIVPTLFNSSL